MGEDRGGFRVPGSEFGVEAQIEVEFGRMQIGDRDARLRAGTTAELELTCGGSRKKILPMSDL
jgi:hypothetical protein